MEIYDYPLEQFFAHVRAMLIVRNYEDAYLDYDVAREPIYVGQSRDWESQMFRIMDYMAQHIDDKGERVYKAVRLIHILNYLSEHIAYFAQAGFVILGDNDDEPSTVDGNLLRALHQTFAVPDPQRDIHPKEIVALTKSYEASPPSKEGVSLKGEEA